MAKAFSVFVNIGGRLLPSLGSAVGQADARLSALGRSVHAANIGSQAAINRLHTGFNKAGRSAQNVGRSMTTSLSLPMMLLGKIGFDQAYQFEKTSNAVQAVGSYTDDEILKLKKYAKELNALFPQTNGEIMQAAEELSRAGFTFEQTYGSLKSALNLSLAGDLDPKTTADIATNVMTALNLPRATAAEASASLTQAADYLAYAANRSNTDIRLMGETFKYVAPMARAAGINIAQLSAASMIMANNGIKGSEAGVAMRSAIVRMVKPTKFMLQALGRLNININDFVKGGKQITAPDIISSLAVDGIDASGASGAIAKTLKDPKLQKSPAKMIERLTKLVSDSLGSDSIIDKSKLAESIQMAVTAAGSEVDLVGFVEALKKSGANLGDIARIFDARQGARLITLLFGDLDAASKEVEEKSKGIADLMRIARMKGIVGVVAELSAAWENLWVTTGESGGLSDIGEVMVTITRGLKNLSEQNPALLRFGVWTMLATAVLGPFIMLAGGSVRVLGSLAWALMSLGRVATIGLAARLVKVAGGIRAIAVAAALGGAGRLKGMATGLKSLGAGMIALHAVGGKRAVFGALIGSLVGFGKSIVRFLLSPLMLLRFAWVAIRFACTPVGAIVIAITAALIALGVWVYNNLKGIGEFFTSFGSAFMEALGPETTGVLDKFTDGIKAVWNWINDLLGPIDATGKKWTEWGETAGKAVASILSFVVDPAQWIAAGEAMMNGIWQGMKNIASGIVDWVAGIGRSIASAFVAGGGLNNPEFGGNPFSPHPGTATQLGGARAPGGPVRANTPYLVGERGPEIFVPSAAGRVETNRTLSRLAAIGRAGDGMGAMRLAPSPQAIVQATGEGRKSVSRGDTSISINVVAQSGDGNEIARQVRRELGIILARMESEQRGMLND